MNLVARIALLALDDGLYKEGFKKKKGPGCKGIGKAVKINKLQRWFLR